MQLALGIDIGGTHTKIGLVNEDGTLESFRRIGTQAKGDKATPFLNSLITQVQILLTEAREDVIGIGISTHGHIDSDRRGPILCNSTPALRGADLRGLFSDRFDLPVIVNNDLTAHTMAEYHYGSGRGVRRFLCLAMGTGIGTGVIIDGEPLRGIEGTAGDTGRVILDPNGPMDAYGVRGSAESLCGVAGIERLASEHYGTDRPAHEIIREARYGEDLTARYIMRQVGQYVGHTLAILSPIFLPNRIAITGGTTEAGDVLLDACRERFYELTQDYHHTLAQLAPDYYSDVEIVIGEMRGETGLVGAVVELFQLF